MLFDLRGKRKRLVQVIYAALALLFGGGFILFGIGSEGGGGLFDGLGLGDGGNGGSTAEPFIEEAENIEVKLRRTPDDEELLARLVRARYNAGLAQLEVDSETGQQSISSESAEEFELAGEAWKRYARLEPSEPNIVAAQSASRALFAASQTAATAAEFSEAVTAAAEAQAVVATERSSLATYFELAQLRYFAGDFEGGDEAADQAKAQVPKAQRRNVEDQLESLRKQGQGLQKHLKASQQAEGQQSLESLENPLGGLSGGGLGAGGFSQSAP